MIHIINWKPPILFSLLGMVLLWGSCSDDDEKSLPTISFVQPVSFLLNTDTLEVKAYLSEVAAETTDFGLAVGGSAIRDQDYILTENSIRIARGEKEGSIHIIPKDNVVEQKEIRLELLPATGYQSGMHPVTFVPVETQDILTCSFAQPAYGVDHYTTISMTLYLGTRQYARPGMNIYIPFEVDPASTAVLGEHFEFDSESLSLTMGAASASASVSIRPLKFEQGKDKVVIRLAESARFQPGLYNKTTLTLISPDNH